MDVIESQLDSIAVDRREAFRLTTALPVLEIEGARRPVLDFSTHGFRAALPDRYRRSGATGIATLHLQAAGYAVRKRVAFEVVHIDQAAVGARFEVLETVSEDTGMLF